MSEKLFGNDYPDFKEFGEPPCATSFPDAFFSEEPLDSAMVLRGRYTYELEAKKICLSCDYQKRCLEYALRHPELQGIWGATTEYQRKNIRRKVKVQIGLPPSRNR
jgi:WhiB family redox-sensing transcriptional regulator